MIISLFKILNNFSSKYIDIILKKIDAYLLFLIEFGKDNFKKGLQEKNHLIIYECTLNIKKNNFLSAFFN